MDRENSPPDQSRFRNERERGFRAYRQTARVVAQASGDLRFPGNQDDREAARTSVDGNAMAFREGNNERLQGSLTDIAQPLTELQVSLVDVERTSEDQGTASLEGGTESAIDDRQNVREVLQEGNQAHRRLTAYQQLAADMSRPLAEVQLSGASIATNSGGASSVDGRPENETESCQDAGLKSKEKAPTERKKRGKHYVNLAENVSGSLAELRVPRTSDEQAEFRICESVPQQQSLSDYNPHATCSSNYGHESFGHETARSAEEVRSERDQRLQGALLNEKAPCLAQRESISEYDPNATCGSCYESCARSFMHGEEETGIEHDNSDQQWDSRSEAGDAKSVAQQQSLTEYNPDATCRSLYEYETSRYSSSQLETSNEGDFGMKQEGRQEMHQESLSEHDEDATCRSGVYRDDFNAFTDYSLNQPNLDNLGTCTAGMESSPSKSPVETETHLDTCSKDERNAQSESCYSQTDGETTSKRSKLNSEVTGEQLSISRREQSDAETPSLGRVESSHESNSGVSSMQSGYLDSMAQSETQECGLRYNGFDSRVRNDEILRSDFEHMNLEDYYMVESNMASDYSLGSWSNRREDESTQSLHRDLADSRLTSTDVSYSNRDYVVNGSFLGEGASDFNDSMGSAGSNTSQEVAKGKKRKATKLNTKNAYIELAKNVAGEFQALNSELEKTEARDNRTAREQSAARRRELGDGNRDQAKDENNSLRDTQREIRQQTSVTNDLHAGRSIDVGGTVEGVSSTDGLESVGSSTHTSSKHTGTASRRNRETREAAELRRAQIEEQQRLTDNMAPELQALVMEMMQRDEVELGGGHILYSTNLTPPVPPRLQPQRGGGGGGGGACVRGDLQQSAGKKSGKGKKKKGHYVELAGIIAPELAAVNTTLMNGHRKEPEHSIHEDCRGAVGHSRKDSNRGARAAIASGSRNSEVSIHDQPSGSGMSSRGQSLTQSRAQLAASQRQRRGNENRKHSTSPDSAVRGPGKENRGPSRKQKKSKEEDAKSRCSQMAGNVAPSLQMLNAQLEEQQRQQRAFMSGATSHPREERPEDSVTRDGRGVMDKSSSSHIPENGFK